jgi:hypothetical protein
MALQIDRLVARSMVSLASVIRLFIVGSARSCLNEVTPDQVAGSGNVSRRRLVACILSKYTMKPAKRCR